MQGRGFCSTQRCHSSCCAQLQSAAILRRRQSWASGWLLASTPLHKVIPFHTHSLHAVALARPNEQGQANAHEQCSHVTPGALLQCLC